MKLERLLSMIYMLLNHEVISASELALKYNVSQRTIYRDIDTLCAAGIPIVSYQGVKGGYGIIEGYKMEKSLLGSNDVAVLIAVLHSISAVLKDDQAKETIQKLKTVQPEQSSNLFVDIGSELAFRETLQMLWQAVNEHRVVTFRYISQKNEKSERVVEPVRMLYQFNVWYLYGYCRARQDYRRFRLSRMMNVHITTMHFQEHSISDDQIEQLHEQKDADVTEITVHFEASTLARAMDIFYDMDKTFHDDGTLTVKVRTTEASAKNWLLPILLSFGENANVIKPLDFRKAVKEKLEKIIQRYSEV